MKRLLILSMGILCSVMLYGGGLQTNSNQSASYIRMLARFGSTEMDGVYYNPAGLVMLKDGFTFSLNNQSVFQKRMIKSNFPTLANGEYREFDGNVTAPFFPSIYAAYKIKNFTISFGFSPIGGGGSSEFKKGLPSFEIPISLVPGMLSNSGLPTTAYAVDMDMKGYAIFFGYQLGLTYKINDMFGAFLGGRLVAAHNEYEGYMRNIQVNSTSPLNPSGEMRNAYEYLSQLATATGNPSLQAVADQLSDKKLDVLQKGYGFTPIIGVNFNYNNLNIGARFEFRTKLELENDTKENDVNMAEYNDGVKSRSDMPATLSLGVEYKLLPNLKLATGGQYYFDKNTNYNGREKFIDNNSWEISLGAEYGITEKILVSAGYLRFQTGVGAAYQNDINHSLSSNSFGLGGAYIINDMFKINIGGLYTGGVEDTVNRTETSSGINYDTKYGRRNWVFSLGLDIHF